MYNRVILMGRIVNDLELKTTPQGLTVCSFRLAVDRPYQKAGEEKKTDFINIVAWRQTAEFVTRYFAKGRMILIEGELQTRQYTDKNGNPATWTEVVTSSVKFTGEKKAEDSGNQGGYYGIPQTAVNVSNPMNTAPLATAPRAANPRAVATVPDDYGDYPF